MGDGKGRTVLIRNYNASNADEGFLTFLAGSNSSSVRDLGIVAAKSSLHGSAISLIASAANAPDFSLFVNLWLSADPGGSWDVTVNVDGKLRKQSLSACGTLTSKIAAFSERQKAQSCLTAQSHSILSGAAYFRRAGPARS
jgi:hypothetical protein